MLPLFKKLLGRQAYGIDPGPVAGTDTGDFLQKQRSILNMFRMDLHAPPLHSFEEGETERDHHGDLVRNYYKKLDYKECGIFDRIQVKAGGNQAFHIIFRSSDPAAVGLSEMKRIIGDLYDIYGCDSNNKGLYEEERAAGASEKQLYLLFGRDWMDYPRYPYPVSLRKYAEEVFISIWGLGRQDTA